MKIKMSIPPKVKKLFKWLGKEVVSGVVVAAAVAIGTQLVVHYSEIRQVKEKLESIYLGLSRQYVESMLGVAVVETTEEDGIRAYYKLPNSVVSCSYYNDQVVAFFVIMGMEGKMYQVPYSYQCSKPSYLTQFSYAEISEQVGQFEMNCPATNDDFAYYAEIYYGANPLQYNYFLVGNYKDYFDDEYLPLVIHALAGSDDFYGGEEHQQVRARAKPNVFGMIDGAYAEKIGLLPNDEKLQTHCMTLFRDWG